MIDQVKKHMAFIALSLIGLIVAIGIWALFTDISVTNAGNTKEAGLNNKYPDNASYLSDCVVRIRETAGVAIGQSEAFDRITENAVKGRYSGDSSAQVGRGALFSAIAEEYPDLSGLSRSFDNVMTVINGCRTDYRSQQTALLDMIRDYESWRTGSFTVRTFGGEYPSDNLKAEVGDQTLTGSAALEQMRRVVVVGEASRAYETGELEAEGPFGTNTSNEE